MYIDLTSANPALGGIFDDPNQVITLDANFLIPPDRSNHGIKAFDFATFQSIWLDPIFEVFVNLAIHEAVYDELISQPIKSFIDQKINNVSPRLRLHKDSSLSSKELVLRDTIEERMYPLTKYDPMLDNKADRGEVKSLAYIAVKGLPYFAAHDSDAIQLIEKAEEWMTGLDNIQAVKMYELIFYLHKVCEGNKKALRMLYKYQYFLTGREKQMNPNWGHFISAMEALYPSQASDFVS